MNTLLDAVYLATILDPGLPDHIIYHLDVIIDGSETTPQLKMSEGERGSILKSNSDYI